MTTEEIRIAVAEACGWKLSPPNRSWPNPYWTSPVDHVLRTFEELPNYPEDLNACAEFENMLSADDKAYYVSELADICGEFPTCNPFNEAEFTTFATALQRCEAFLRIKGKWTDDQKGNQ